MIQKLSLKTIVSFGVFIGLSSCSVGPDYTPPDLNLPGTYYSGKKINPEKFEVNAPPAANVWWTSFKDPELEQLINLASVQNLNVQIVLERVNQARANSYNALADFLPVAELFGQYVKNKTSAARFPGLANNNGIQFEIYSAGGTVSWELDIFGRLRRSYEAVNELEKAAVFTSIDAVNLVQSEIAIAYIQLRGAQNQKRIAESNASKQNETLNLLEKKFNVGTIGALDFERAKAQSYLTQSRVFAYDTLINNSLNRISTLLGNNPGDVPPTLENLKAIPEYQGPVSIATPSELILRRPDLRLAESQAHAATAQIGLAMGDLFPKVTFTGTLSRDARQIKDLNTAPAQAYNYGPRISWAILDIAHILTQVKAAKSNASAQILQYRSDVLGALEEVNNNLLSINNYQISLELLKNSAEASRKAEQIAKVKYDAGFISYLDLLVAQSSTLEAEAAYAQAQVESSVSYVTLFKALGGAWEEETKNS